MNSLNFCGESATAVYPFHGVSSMLLDLHQQMAEQYHVYSAGRPAAHTLSVAERLAGRVGHALLPTQETPRRRKDGKEKKNNNWLLSAEIA